MPLPTGTRLGSYEILAPLGAGGMGEVYRAADSKLGREVAIKVLPQEFARDPERLARFEREARLLASLNHPNIAAIYGLEQADGLPFLVLELVPGPTLAERLASARLEPAEALRISIQIAEALEAAHEKGVVHRDLKPANVKVTPEGRVKVLDFGLAKALAGDEPAPDPSRSPTLSMLATRAGIILGTAAYMSPEQARGRPVDRRTDVWSFGCVLYEALTGRQAFAGETVSHIIVAVLEREPDWEALPPGLPGGVRELLRRCLQKDSARRLRDMGDARLELEEALSRPAGVSSEPVAVAAPLAVKRRPWLLSSAAPLFLLTTLLLAFVHFREKPPAAEPVQFEISPPEKGNFGPSLSLSPDGRRIVFLASAPGGRRLLWVRALDSLKARPLAGIEGIEAPLFWSYDSRFIVFWDNAGKLRKVEASGGPPQAICDSRNVVIGGAWNRDGVIIFASTSVLMRVSAAGGSASPLTALDPARQESMHLFPTFLPDGKHFVYYIASNSPEINGIYLGSLDARPEQQNRERLLASQFGLAYAPSPDPALGYLLFLREGTLMAQPFDVRRLELAGESFPIAEQVASFLANGLFSASANGVLAYMTGSGPTTQLTWFDRSGKVIGTAGESGPSNELALSPDGTRLAGSRRDNKSGNFDIWLLEFSRGASTRFTFHPRLDQYPVWSPEGTRIVFASNRDGPFNLYQKVSSGSGEEEALLKSSDTKYPQDWSRDGRFLLYTAMDPKTGSDLWVLPLEGDRKPVPFVRTEFNEGQGRFSPDGHWVAYRSDESGSHEIYVRPFPPSSGGRWMVSKGGGTQPLWRRDGKELFYLSGQKLMAVDVATNPTFQVGITKLLFEAPIWAPGTAALNIHRYAVTADGKRFLINSVSKEAASAPITVVLNWTAGLKR